MVPNSNGMRRYTYNEPSSTFHFSVNQLLPEITSVIHFLYIHPEDVYMYYLFKSANYNAPYAILLFPFNN